MVLLISNDLRVRFMGSPQVCSFDAHWDHEPTRQMTQIRAHRLLTRPPGCGGTLSSNEEERGDPKLRLEGWNAHGHSYATATGSAELAAGPD